LDPVSDSQPNPPAVFDGADLLRYPDLYAWQSPPKFQDRVWLHWLLFFATIGTTMLAGVDHYLSFTQEYLKGPQPPLPFTFIIHGLWYSATILAILGCHEMGHYIACRRYDVDASRPFFLPVPFVMTGTLGAFIRIREPIPSKRALFDIGIAGPIAGFVVAVPALIIGLLMSNVTPAISPQNAPPGVLFVNLGEPLLLKAVSWVIWGIPPEGYAVNWHPIAFGAWFGMLATALNLFPIGQLDGGHISYAVLGRKSSNVTLVMIACAMALTYFSRSWAVWTGLTIVMLFVFGRHHPRTFDENVPLDRKRLLLALFAVIMFILCFTPSPIEPMQMMR
jgi:membrane-associated protease RseP (regulator of RpoE activity)